MFNYSYPIIFQTETETEKCTRIANLKVINYKGVLCSVNDDHMNNMNIFAHAVTDSEVAPRKINRHYALSGGSRISQKGCQPQRGC